MAGWLKRLLLKIARANIEEFGSDPINGYDYVPREREEAQRESEETKR